MVEAPSKGLRDVERAEFETAPTVTAISSAVAKDNRPLRVLFLCARNRRRSPTAEPVFAGRPGLEVASAGLAPDAEEVAPPQALAWADLIMVMEPAHRAKLRRQ